MNVSEWIEETRTELLRKDTHILTEEQLEKIRLWQYTGWIARDFDSASDIADIQLAFATLLLNHAFAVNQREKEWRNG